MEESTMPTTEDEIRTIAAKLWLVSDSENDVRIARADSLANKRDTSKPSGYVLTVRQDDNWIVKEVADSLESLLVKLRLEIGAPDREKPDPGFS
jgi:hypothetical protein